MDDKNIITPFKNGPLHITGTLELKNSNGELLEKTEEYIHKVGFSERGSVPIEYYMSDQWFLSPAIRLRQKPFLR